MDFEYLYGLVEQGHSIRKISSLSGKCVGSVRHWLKKYDFKTAPQPNSKKPPNYVTCLSCKRPYVPHFSSVKKYCSLLCQKKHGRHLRAHAGGATDRTLKGYLIDLHGAVCMDPLCAWDFERRPLSIELDHIDGDHTNRSIDNVRLLCPNCHSLTPTYKNRNKGNGRPKRREYHRTKVPSQRRY